MMTNFANLRRKFAFIAVAFVSLVGGSLGFASQAQAAPENLGTITWDGTSFSTTTLNNVDVGDYFDFVSTAGMASVAHIVDGGALVSAGGNSCSVPVLACRVGFGITTRTITVDNLSGGGTLIVKGVAPGYAQLATITLVPSGGAGGSGAGGGGGAQLGIVQLVTYTLNTGGGACVVDGARIESGSKHYALGYTYVPGADECSRAGFTFVGWAKASAPTVPLDLPLLRVWDSTIWRYFIADSYDLVAVWKAVS